MTCRWTKRLKGKAKFIYICSKAEAVPVRAIKAERRSGDTAPPVLNVGTVSGQPHARANLPPE